MPVMLASIVGKFKGGPNNGMISVELDAKDGVAKGEYKGKNGGRAGFQGKLVDGGKKLLGFWYDYDLKVTPGDRYVCTCVLTLDAASGGKKLDAALKTKEGGSEAWTAQRFNLASAVPRTDGKMTAFAFKDKAIFDRVSDNLVAKKAAWVEAERVTALAESVPRRNFDGALEYIPGPGAVGAEYMTQHDIDRMLAAREDGHRARAIASWEAKIEALKAKVAAGADDLKPKLALAERLLKGEHGAEKLKERAPFKPALSGFAPAGEEKPPRGPDEYATFYEVMRAMDKADRERNKTELAALEEALPKAEAALAAGGGDADKLKKAVETTKKAIKGLKGLLLMEERPKFKPTSSDPTVVSGKHAEYMPDVYLTAHELERKLRADDVAWAEKHTAKLEREAEKLAAKAAAGTLDDLAKRRQGLLPKLIAGEKGAAKLAERKKFRGTSGDAAGQRLSSSIMLNPKNIEKMM